MVPNQGINEKTGFQPRDQRNGGLEILFTLQYHVTLLIGVTVGNFTQECHAKSL